MNIARSLEKPPVPRSKKRRRVRRLKRLFNLFILILLIASASYAIYWAVIGFTMLWHEWGAPRFTALSRWLIGLSSAERFTWLNRFGWVSATIGMLTSLIVYRRPSRWACRLSVVCFTYSYVFLWYVLWLVWRSLFEMSSWTENGLIGLAVLCYVLIIRHVRLPRSGSSAHEVPS